MAAIFVGLAVHSQFSLPSNGESPYGSSPALLGMNVTPRARLDLKNKCSFMPMRFLAYRLQFRVSAAFCFPEKDEGFT